MRRRIARTIAQVLPLIGIVGCAAVRSQLVDDSKATPDGLVYYMPRRPFVVTVSTPNPSAPPTAGDTPAMDPASAAKPAAAKPAPAAAAQPVKAPLTPTATPTPKPATTVTVSEGVAEADLSERFVLSQGLNPLAKTEFNVSIGANGLLKSSNSNATSEVATALQSLASFAGAAAGVLPGPMPGPLAVEPLPAQDGCPLPGAPAYQYLIYPNARAGDPQQKVFCGYTVTWQLAAGAAPWQWAPGDKKAHDSARTRSSDNQSGLFYRHELPYLVTVTGNGMTTVSVVTSPDDSEIDFFPVRRSFFANNTANITVTDGVITGVDQTTEGELTAAASLPASVLTSYTTAIGSMLGDLTTNSSAAQKLLAQQEATSAAQAQNAVCRSTITAASLSGATLANALAAINAVCLGH